MTNSKRRKRPTPTDLNKMQLVVTDGGGEEPFKLPEGWVVKVKPRRLGSSISDKYYFEPGTGRQFRSLLSIKRYLDSKGENLSCSRVFEGCWTSHHYSPACSARPVYSSATNMGKIWKPDELQLSNIENNMVTTSTQDGVSSSIPDGWIVEKVPRKNGSRSDKYYIEPVSGLKLRSLQEVHRFLAEEYQFIPKKKPALDMIIKPSTPSKISSSSKKIITSPPNHEYFDVSEPPPERVTWVLSNEEGDSWSPFVKESKVPVRVKELWHETFMIGMTGGAPPAPTKPNPPQLTWIQHIHPDSHRHKV